MSANTVSMPVSELIGDEIITVAPDSTLLDVAVALADADIGAVAVGAPGKVHGVISERDIVRFIAGGGDAGSVTASSLASGAIVTCAPDSTVADVATEMCTRYVRHIVVRDETGPIGIVSARDLLGVYAADDEARASS